MTRMLGSGLAILGAALLVLYLGYHFVVGFVLYAGIPLIVRMAITSIVVGGLLVIASLIRERIREQRQESSREVEK